MKAGPHPLARPLVIIGGFLDFDVSPVLLKGKFKSLTGEDRIVTVSVALCGSFEECRAHVIDAVQKAYPSADPACTVEVDVIGVSLGGLAARYAATPSHDPARPRRLKLARLFTIGSPHSGSRLATIGFTGFHNDVRRGSTFLKTLAETDHQAGYELYPYVRLGDEIVGAENAAPPGRPPLWLASPPLMIQHLAALSDPRILADIALRLRGDPPFSTLPGSPLPE